MKSEKSILIVFLLNFVFSVFELIGGIITGSVAIISDCVHDIGDALSVGVSYAFEKKSKRQPDEKYTYGYLRYSLLGSFIVTAVLLSGSITVIVSSVRRLFQPVEIDYNGMLIFAFVGVFVNLLAAFFLHGKESLNIRAIRLHMLEDVLGWVVVLIGAVFMRFTGLSFIDPLMSIGVSVFIFISAAKSLKQIMYIFLEKVPENLCTEKIKERLFEIEGIKDIHHFHLRSLDGSINHASMHIVTDENPALIKQKIRKELYEQGIIHTVIEFEASSEACLSKECDINKRCDCCHGHNH